MVGRVNHNANGSVTVISDNGATGTFTQVQWVGNEAACIASVGTGIKVPVPDTINASQARVALLQAGLLEQVEALVAAAETPQAIKIFWEYETRFWRESPALNAMAGQLGLSSDQLDDLFRAASQIVV